MYSELIKSDIPRPSDVNPSQPPASRPSLPFVMKPSHEGPSVVKPTQEELQAQVKSLEKKKRSVKRKAQAPPESSLTIRGKILRLGAPSPPSTANEWGSFDQVLARGQAPPPIVKVSKAGGSEKSFGEEHRTSSVSSAHLCSESLSAKHPASSYDTGGWRKELLWI